MTLIHRRQFFGLQLDRGNLSNALTDNLLKDLHLSSNDYNNVSFSEPLMNGMASSLSAGDDNSTSGLFIRRVPRPAPHQAIWLQANSPYHDDAMGNCLSVCSFCSIEMNADPTIAWSQSFMTNRTSFYITRALIGACEGGFIPGTILFTTYFYKSRELSVRLACFWSTLNVNIPPSRIV